MKRLHYILTLVLFLTSLAILGKVGFLLYNGGDDCTMDNVLRVLWTGLPLDLSVSALVALPVWVVTGFTLFFPNMRLRAILSPYLTVVLFFMVLITAGDLVMYHHWKFKLDASIFSYMTSPGAAGASAPAIYIITCISTAVLVVLSFILAAIFITPRRIGSPASQRIRGCYALLGLVLMFAVYGINGKRGDEASAFFSDKIVLNHAAVNPVAHMAHSMYIYTQPSASQCRYMTDEECDELLVNLYPEDMDDITDTLFCVEHPNILTIQLESFGASFVESLGGAKGVSPELDAWMQRGISFTNAWSNSFRTDRGTASVLSGYLSYPTYSLLMTDSCLSYLPSLAHSLAAEGYRTSYLYGGNSTGMNKRKYMLSTGFQKMWDISNLDVPEAECDAWGANDSIALQRVYRIISESPDSCWYMGCQTISSHEPWDVPYHRLDNEVYNAFAYTDHCVGSFLTQLSQTPAWRNLVVIIFADHGNMYQLDYQHPDFFRMPLLMVGGAVREPKRYDMFINQSDIVATLLSQMGIKHSQFPWSRNVFSRKYTYPFAYCTYPAGTLFADSTGVTMTDLQSGQVVYSEPDDGGLRVSKTKAILQRSYDRLKDINIP